jgi:hypothetical protein
MNIAQLAGWLPIRVYWPDATASTQPMVDWLYLGERRLTDPFFEQTITSQLRHPFHLLFRHQTPIEALAELRERRPGLPLRGFIFHMSRCGSTLSSQMLAALPQSVVLSEAPPIDTVLRARFRGPELTDERRVAWLQWIVNALAQPRQGGETQCFIKFDSWHVADLPLIHRAFPDTPWVFLYREPIEVMASHANHRGAQMMQGVLEPEIFGLDRAAVRQTPFEEYCARVIGSFCEAALRHRGVGKGLLLNYRQLPDAIPDLVSGHFGVNLDESDLGRMRSAARFHAKNPVIEFVADAETKQREATETMRRMAEQWAYPLYRQLENARRIQEEGGTS